MRFAVLIPCYNEAPTIGQVVRDFQRELPNAEIYVFDNNSTDSTAEVASESGAIVIPERRQGKGYVVQSMFRKIDADVYVMVDGDGTYPASSVRALIEPILNGEADMVVGSRLNAQSRGSFKAVNFIGNKLIRWLLRIIFHAGLTDVLSGYRAFSRNFAKGIPLFGGGFEVETELTIKALQRGYRIEEVPVNLEVRPSGSHSKINLIRDGFLILNTILALFRDTKPLTFFGGAGVLFILIAVSLLFLPVSEPYRVIAVAVLSVLGMLFLLSGLMLHTIVRRFQEFDHQLRIIESEHQRTQKPM